MEIPNVLTRLAVAIKKRKEAHSWLYHLFLTTHGIAQQDTRKGYRALAHLICKGYFATILTSNMDTALEAALEEEGLYPFQYEVLVVGENSNEQILDALEGQQSGICIVKLPCVQLQDEQDALSPVLSTDIQIGLQHYFNHNIIIVGCMDREEDAKIALNFHGEGGIYYVRQDTPHYDDIVVKCINKQNKHLADFIITETYGEFNTFFSTLETLINDSSDWKQITSSLRHTAVEERDALSPRIQTTVKLPPVSDEKVDSLRGSQQSELPAKQRTRSTVFISYSHKNTMHRDRLLTHLKPLERDGLINVDVWSDEKIKAGDKWQEKIMQAIEEANIAVLLVSADFFASDFITRFELPPLEEAADKGEMVILPVLASFCDYEHTTLARFQSVNNPSTPLSKTSYDDNEKVWKMVAKRIREIAHP